MTIDPTQAAVKIIESGLLGALLVLTIVALLYMTKALLSEKDKQIKKGDENIVVLKSVGDVMNGLLVEIQRRPPHNEKREKKD